MKKETVVCPECKKSIKKSSIRNLFRGPVCPHCGFGITELSVIPKSKTVAIILAAFFGFWSYLYTYENDRRKFWVFFAVSFSGFGLVLGWSWALGDATRRPKSFFLDYPNGQIDFGWFST